MPEHRTTRLNIFILLCLITAWAALSGFLYKKYLIRQPSSPLAQSTLEQKSKKPVGIGKLLVPHKALYDVALIDTRNGSQVLNITGQMLYEWQPTCEAWISNHHFNMRYEYVDAPAVRLSSNFSTFELFDKTRLDFISQRRNNGVLFEDIRGFAVPKSATYTQPEGLSFDLPQGTLFPASHTLSVLEQIHAGQKFSSTVLFDGSDLDGPVAVSSFIGVRLDPQALDKLAFKGNTALDHSLLEAQAHNVRLAFFPLEGEGFTADYEMNLIFHENGVVSDIVIEYDDFTVSQKLIALEKRPSRCEQDQ